MFAIPSVEKSKAITPEKFACSLLPAGGESSWWQGDCKPNGTRTVTSILESAMNKEEGQGERLSEHQFS